MEATYPLRHHGMGQTESSGTKQLSTMILFPYNVIAGHQVLSRLGALQNSAMSSTTEALIR